MLIDFVFTVCTCTSNGSNSRNFPDEKCLSVTTLFIIYCQQIGQNRDFCCVQSYLYPFRCRNLEHCGIRTHNCLRCGTYNMNNKRTCILQNCTVFYHTFAYNAIHNKIILRHLPETILMGGVGISIYGISV